MGEILVPAEHRDGALSDVTLEMLAVASRLGSATALITGPEALAGQLVDHADRVLVIDDPAFANYDAEPWLAAVSQVARERSPQLILVAHTATGMDMAPALSVRLGIPVVTDCLEVGLEGDVCSITRRVYGGKVVQRLVLEPAPTVLVTVRPGGQPSPRTSPGELESLEVPDLSALRARKFLRTVAAELQDLDIGEADFLVSIGRGVGKESSMPAVAEFAEKVGATLSCSRPVADKGWLPKSRQVGTSGRVVRPKVYLALGISGAYQHVAGMRGADTIIAVNTDPAAPIFDVAHYGIIADLFEVLPALQAALSER